MKPRFRQVHYKTFFGLRSHWKPMNKQAKEYMDMIYYRRGLTVLHLIDHAKEN